MTVEAISYQSIWSPASLTLVPRAPALVARVALAIGQGSGPSLGSGGRGVLWGPAAAVVAGIDPSHRQVLQVALSRTVLLCDVVVHRIFRRGARGVVRQNAGRDAPPAHPTTQTLVVEASPAVHAHLAHWRGWRGRGRLVVTAVANLVDVVSGCIDHVRQQARLADGHRVVRGEEAHGPLAVPGGVSGEGPAELQREHRRGLLERGGHHQVTAVPLCKF